MLEQGLLRICDGRGTAVGLGFLVSDTVALTCAHVVTAALGTPVGTPPGPDARVSVDLPLVAGRPRAEVAVEWWLPPRGPGDGPGVPGMWQSCGSTLRRRGRGRCGWSTPRRRRTGCGAIGYGRSAC
ncbi:hypothetical protein G6539_10250 [Streptomyces albidoflavus]|nr:hypothetical protein [Streptomyces albidoflavus]